MNKRKITFGIFFAAIASIGWNTYHQSDALSPCDAPLVGDHTGAPGETNCTGCHLGTNNSGPGTVIFDVGGGITQYVPGQSYLCTVTVNQTGVNKMGYCCTSLRNSNNSAAGTFALTMPARTRLFTSGGRNYCSHNPCGADALTVGNNSWTFNWTAPSSNVGNITLYIGALATNHDHATTGDDAYTTSVILTPSATSVNEIDGIGENISLYPNPVSDKLFIHVQNVSSAKIELFNAIGESILKQSISSSGLSSMDVSALPNGIYFIQLTAKNKLISKKFIRQ